MGGGDDVAGDDVEGRIGGFDVADHTDLEQGVTLAGIEDDDVEAGGDEFGETDFVVGAGADGRGAD